MTGKTRKLRHLAGILASSSVLIAAGPAFGQDATDQGATTQAGAADTLQEVVVTAERRAENVQTTPISVVAITGADLQSKSVSSVNDLQAVAPDLTVQSGNGQSTLNIRGIGIEPVGVAESGVAVVRDGIVNSTPGSGLDMPFYDMADVEVLRGPQGTFSGDNSTGGAVIINSQNPNFRGINGYVTAKVGDYSDNALQGAVNLPVSDTLAMRFAVNREVRGSFFYDLGSAESGPNEFGPYFIPAGGTCAPLNRNCSSWPGTSKTGSDPGNLNNSDMRVSLLWKPTDNLQSLTKIEIDDSTTDGVPTQPNINTFAPLGAGLPCPTGHGTAPNCTSLYYSGYSGSPYVLNSWLSGSKYDTDISMYSEELRYTFSGGTQARLLLGDQEMGYDTLSNATGDSVDIQNGQPDTSTTQYHDYSGEFDLLSPTSGALSWIAGATINRSFQEFGSFSINTAPPYSPAAPEYSSWVDGQNVTYKSWGTFGQVSWQMTHTLQFQVGARLGWDIENGFGAEQLSRAPLSTLFFIANSSRDDHFAPEDNAVLSGKVGFNWTPLPGQYFYVFWAHGYKPGLGNFGVAPTTKEWVNDSEIGWKGTMADGHVQTDVGAYYMQYYQMQQQLFLPDSVQSSTNDGNLPYSTVKGIEASMQTRLGHFGFSLSADLNKSVLGQATTAKTYAFPSDYGITNQCAPGVTPNAGNTNCTDYTPYLVSLSGESLPFSPLFQGNASIQYDIALGDTSLTPRVTYSYVGKEYASLFQIPFYEEPAHGLVNAYLDWSAGPWLLTAYATNLANKLYVTSITATSEYFGNPRQIGLQLSRSF